MSVEELALDTGIRKNTAEYDSFVGCVRSILDYGCSYSQETMSNIRRRCRASKMPLAQEVLDECERVQSSDKRVRRSKLKWWQSYVPKVKRKRRRGRQMSPLFTGKRRERSRSRSPARGKRSMSPMFEPKRPEKNRRIGRAEPRRGRAEPRRGRTETPTDVPRWPGRPSGPAWPSRKRQRR